MSEVPDCSCCCGGTSCVGRMEWTSEARPTTVRRRNAARDGSSYICSGSNRRCDARWTTRHEEMGAVNPPPSARLWPSGSVSIDTWRSSFRVRNRNVEPRLSRHRLPFLALSASSDPRATKRRRKEDDVVVSHEHFRSIREWPSKHEPRRVSSRMGSQEGDRTRDTCDSSTSQATCAPAEDDKRSTRRNAMDGAVVQPWRRSEGVLAAAAGGRNTSRTMWVQHVVFNRRQTRTCTWS